MAARSEISRRLLYRVVRELGIESRREGFPAVAFWRLPTVVHSPVVHSANGDGVHDCELPATTGDSDTSEVQSCTSPGESTTGLFAPFEPPSSNGHERAS
jgi:hypothetical protein